MDSPFSAANWLDISATCQKKTTTINGTGPVQIVSAFSGNLNPRINGTHVDILAFQITSTNNAPATLTIADGAGTQDILNWSGTINQLILTPVILQQQANSAWTLTASANASGFNVTVFYQLREAYASAY